MGLTATPKNKRTKKRKKGNNSNKTYQKKLLLITFSKTYFPATPSLKQLWQSVFECTRAIQCLHFSYSVSFISVGLGAAQISLQVNISLSRMVPHREVQQPPSEVLSVPTPHCQKFWHLLLVFHSLLCIFFLLFFSPSSLCFPSISSGCSYYLQSHRLSAVGFLCFLCLTGSFFDSISITLGFSFSICFPSNQCLSCFKLPRSLVCPVGYLPHCDKKDELSSAFPADLKCCHPSTWR